MTDTWTQSTELMLLGMGTVFVFLTLLVVSVTLMSATLNLFFKNEAPIKKTTITDESEIAAVAVSAWLKSKS